MSLGNIILIAVGVVVILLVVGLILIYNRLITLKNRFKNSFSQISVQLQRRYDLIPNLVTIAKEYMTYEQETLNQVITARNKAVDANKLADTNPNDPAKIQALSAAENGLTKSMGSLFALMENYPDLKASQPMQNLMEQLTSTENKVAFARQAYNDSVMSYNTACEVFPNSFIANFFHFDPATLLELDNPQATKPINVSFR